MQTENVISAAWFLVGPTAVGKTAVAQYLAERTGAAILSVDAMLVYRGMDIGTAKPTAQERGEVPYFGILGTKSGGVVYGMRGRAYASEDLGAHWQRIDLGGLLGAIQGGRELADGRALIYGNDGLLATRSPGAEGFKVEQIKSRRTVAALLQVGDRFLIAGPNGLGWTGQERAAK